VKKFPFPILNCQLNSLAVVNIETYLHTNSSLCLDAFGHRFPEITRNQ